METTFEKRLKSYFDEKDIEDEKLQEAIRRVIGKPDGTVEEILKYVQDGIDEGTEIEHYYDKNFESVLDMYEDYFSKENGAELLETSCGVYGLANISVASDLSGVWTCIN